jgi:hypothetical protein
MGGGMGRGCGCGRGMGRGIEQAANLPSQDQK